jgi:hypothetical protein
MHIPSDALDGLRSTELATDHGPFAIATLAGHTDDGIKR